MKKLILDKYFYTGAGCQPEPVNNYLLLMDNHSSNFVD